MDDHVTRSVQEFAERYDEWADEYDDDYDDGSEDAALYRESVSSVVAHASPAPGDTVVDLGTGTGAVALALADDAGRVVGRDVSEGMLERAREKAAERDVENATFGRGRFRAPAVETADVVVSNWAIHHLAPDEQCEAIGAAAALEPRRFVLGAATQFDDRDPADPVYDPEPVYPATVGRLVAALTGAGFAVTAVEQVHEQCGVLVARQPASG